MIFGRITKGATPIILAADTKIVSRVTFETPGRIPKITMYLDGNGGGGGAVQQVARGIIYGANDVLLGEGEEVVVAAGQAADWVDFPFRNIAGGIVLPNAGDYHLGIHVGPSSNVIRVWV